MNKICIIPAWNEEENIYQVIKDIYFYFNEIVVVDDGSIDGTVKEVSKIQNELREKAQIVLLSHIINRGQGSALETGNEYARRQGADLVVHFDGDGQFRAQDIPVVMEPIEDDNVDVVLGSRFLGKKSKLPLSKKLVIFPLARLVNRLFFNIKLKDPQSGFRALNKTALDKIRIEQDGMAHCSEIVAKATKYNLRIKEVPIIVFYNRYGTNFSKGVKIIKDLLIKKIVF